MLDASGTGLLGCDGNACLPPLCVPHVRSVTTAVPYLKVSICIYEPTNYRPIQTVLQDSVGTGLPLTAALMAPSRAAAPPPLTVFLLSSGAVFSSSTAASASSRAERQPCRCQLILQHQVQK